MLALKLIHVWKGDPWRLSFQKQNSSPAVIALRLKQLKCIFDILFKEIVAYWFKFHLFFLSHVPLTANQYFLIARFMGPTWGPSGAVRTQVGPMLAPWSLLSVLFYIPASAEQANALMDNQPFVIISHAWHTIWCMEGILGVWVCQQLPMSFLNCQVTWYLKLIALCENNFRNTYYVFVYGWITPAVDVSFQWKVEKKTDMAFSSS